MESLEPGRISQRALHAPSRWSGIDTAGAVGTLSRVDAAATEHLTLRDYLAPVLARRWLVLAVSLLAFGAAYAYYAHKGQVYRVSTKLYVAQEGDPLVGVGAGFSDD